MFCLLVYQTAAASVGAGSLEALQPVCSGSQLPYLLVFQTAGVSLGRYLPGGPPVLWSSQMLCLLVFQTDHVASAPQVRHCR